MAVTSRSRTRLSRPRRGRVVGGVCAGIARRYGWSPWRVRAAFLLSCVLPGPQVVAYLALWIVLPADARG